MRKAVLVIVVVLLFTVLATAVHAQFQCSLGETQSCVTVEGCNGIQLCRNILEFDPPAGGVTAGEWGPCIPSDPSCIGAGACEDGDIQTCTSGGEIGIQFCTDGVWGQCDLTAGLTCDKDPQEGSGDACSSDSQCPVDEYCNRNGRCHSKSAERSATCIWNTGIRGVADAFQRNGEWQTAEDFSETLEFPKRLINSCTYEATLKTFAADDTGTVSINGNQVFSEPAVCDTSVSNPNKDITNRIIKQRSVANDVTLFVEDICAATRSGETTRSVAASFEIKRHLPNPGQVCENGQLRPLAAGTDESCGFYFEQNCNALDGTYGVPTSTPAPSCDGNYRIFTIERQLRDYFCPGLYANSCDFEPVQTGSIETSREFCEFGCSAGACNENSPPSISSITVSPRFAGSGTIITVNATGSDPDTIFKEGGSTASSVTGAAVAGLPVTGLAVGDELDPNNVNYLTPMHADISSWDVTSEITGVTLEAGQICIRHTKAGQWPLGPQGAAEGNPWIFGNVNGQWHAGTFEWLRPGQVCKALDTEPPDSTITDRVGGGTKTEPLASWKPQIGETVGLAVSAISRAGQRTISERSNIVLVEWTVPPGTGGGSGPGTGDGGGEPGTTAQSARQRVRLACSSESSQTFGPDPFEQKPFNPDLCNSQLFYDQNPTCEFEAPWAESGTKEIFCRLIDSSGAMSLEEASATVTVDLTPPSVVMLSPADGSEQNSNFLLRVSDTDNLSGVDRCEYSVNNGIWKNRTCSSGIAITVGQEPDAPANCPDQGTLCSVRARAFDSAGNVGETQKSFFINYIFTNITAPEAGSFQTDDFDVQITDIDSSGAGISRCEYAIGDGAEPGEWMERQCASALNISAGPDGQCSTLGENTCVVQARSVSNTGAVSRVSTRTFSIDYTKPSSRITSPRPMTWHNSDFAVNVEDSVQVGVLASCSYRIVSQGAETRPWTNRECNSGFTVTVGTGSDCDRDGTCQVFVRALSESGNEGVQDNRTFRTLPENVILDFTSMTAEQTERGLEFTGTTSPGLFLPSFAVCRDSATLGECLAAAESDQCGDGACLCESVNSLSCETRCGDVDLPHYYYAKGFSGFSEVEMVSSVSSAICPDLNLAEIDAVINLFNSVEEDLFVLIFQTDDLIQQAMERGDDELVQELEDRMNRLQDALMLTQEHLRFIDEIMRDLTVERSRELLDRSEIVKQQILEILQGTGYQPTILELVPEIDDTMPLGVNVSIPFTVKRSGVLDLHATAACEVRSPSGDAIRKETGCFPTANETRFEVNFTTAEPGEWEFACDLDGTLRSNCAEPNDYQDVSLAFNVFPQLRALIESVSIPTSLPSGSRADIQLQVNNQDDGKFALAGCTLAGPGETKNPTVCQALPASNSTITLTASPAQVGTWNVSSCFINTSTDSSCSGSRSDDRSSFTGSFEVTQINDVHISRVDAPAAVLNDTAASVTVQTTNPLGDRFANTYCDVTDPLGITSRHESQCTGLSANQTKPFTFTLDIDKAGTWSIDACSVDTSTSADCSNAQTTHTVENPATIRSLERDNLTITNAALPGDSANGTDVEVTVSAVNPGTVDRFGRVSCTFRTPSNLLKTETSTCSLFSQQQEGSAALGFTLDEAGTWIADSCSISASLNSDCSGAVVHDVRTDLGAFESTVSATPPPNATGNATDDNTGHVIITSVSAPESALNDTEADVRVNLLNRMSDTFTATECAVTDPDGLTEAYESACRGLGQGDSSSFEFSFQLDKPGTWTVDSCTVRNASSFECSDAETSDTVEDPAFIVVSERSNLTITSTELPVSLNGTDSELILKVSNPSGIDRFGRASCELRKPDNTRVSVASSCALHPRNTLTSNVINFVPDAIGTWSVDSCEVEASLDSSCSSPSTHDTRTNLGTFDVRSSKVTIDSVEAAGARRGVETLVSVSVSSPLSGMHGFAECTVRDASNATKQIESSCKLLRQSDSFDMQFVPGIAGEYTAQCTVFASGNQDCSESEVHDVASASFTVSAPKLEIISVSAPAGDLRVNDSARIDVIVRNQDLVPHSAFVNCTLSDPDDLTRELTSLNRTITAEGTNTFPLTLTADKAGTWSINSCSVYRILNSPSVKESEFQVGKNFIVSERQPAPPPSGGVQPGQCSLNADCPGTNEKCFCSGNSCLSCPAGFACENHQCVQISECSVDADCPDGRCVAGSCTEAPECRTDSQCGQGLECISGKCRLADDSGAGGDGIDFSLLIVVLIIILVPVGIYVYVKKGMSSEEIEYV